VRTAGCLLALALVLGSDAVGATVPTLAISATGLLGEDDTIVVAVTNPSNRVDVEIPQGYAFPEPAPQGAHAFISFSDGTGGGRAAVAPATPPTNDCAGGTHKQVWEARFSSADVFVFLSGQVMTICPLPSNTVSITLASKYWSTPRTAGAYTWRATTADGAQATATIRLPVLLKLTQTGRRPKVRLRARLTENALPAVGQTIQLVVPGRSPVGARTNVDGSATFSLRLKRRTTLYATTALGANAGEPHTLQSNRLNVRIK
jgi:hypothetical protein